LELFVPKLEERREEENCGDQLLRSHRRGSRSTFSSSSNLALGNLIF
jgi:hypothetical protein